MMSSYEASPQDKSGQQGIITIIITEASVVGDNNVITQSRHRNLLFNRVGQGAVGCQKQRQN